MQTAAAEQMISTIREWVARCDGFIASGQCNGEDMVLALNENRFENDCRFTTKE